MLFRPESIVEASDGVPFRLNENLGHYGDVHIYEGMREMRRRLVLANHATYATIEGISRDSTIMPGVFYHLSDSQTLQRTRPGRAIAGWMEGRIRDEEVTTLALRFGTQTHARDTDGLGIRTSQAVAVSCWKLQEPAIFSLSNEGRWNNLDVLHGQMTLQGYEGNFMHRLEQAVFMSGRDEDPRVDYDDVLGDAFYHRYIDPEDTDGVFVGKKGGVARLMVWK